MVEDGFGSFSMDSAGFAGGNRLAGKLLSRLKSGSMLLADRGYDADWIRELSMKRKAHGPTCRPNANGFCREIPNQPCWTERQSYAINRLHDTG
jgi:hypothetical protein